MTAELATNADLARSAPRRILIVLMGSIGDVVRALPLLGRIRRTYPDAHIAWAVEPKSEPILRHHRWLDEVILYDRARGLPQFIPFLRKVRSGGENGGRFDLVLDLQRHLKSGVVARASGAPDRIGFDVANSKEFNHLFSTSQIPPQPPMRLKLMQYQAFGDALGIPPAPVEFGLELRDDEAGRARALIAGTSAPRLGVILGSSWPSRVYFPEATAAVIRELARRSNGGPGLFPILIGGPAEIELAAQVTRTLDRTPVLNLAGQTSLRDLIGIFAECAVALGPDSGPMHIAAAVGCPMVSLWGSTAPARSAPWGFADFAIRGEIPCHPCYLRACPIGRECMRRIAPETIVATIRRATHASASASVDASRYGDTQASLDRNEGRD